MTDEVRVTVSSDADVVAAREKGRELSAQLGFSSIDLTLIVTAISEVARNILLYAREGEIVLRLDNSDGQHGIVVVARDDGPGIPDLDLAMRDSYSTGNGLGLGLPGARRLMDEFEIKSEISKGTTIIMKKWAPERV
ncbi:MAG TPA: anti-sigma regulatory factor [Thermoleophilaceae bacterium]|nr:anti-sigma regulatory factor [Thermoleophilaceae bacterium]